LHDIQQVQYLCGCCAATGEGQRQLLAVSLSRNRIVDYYEVSGKIVIFGSELYLGILYGLIT